MADLRISGASARPRSETDVRLNYGDPSRVIAASNDIGAATEAQFFSTDGGSTWGQSSLPAVAGDSFQSDPAVDWTSDGNAWALAICLDPSGNSRVRSFQSTNAGATWTFNATPSGTQTGADREIIWVDHSATSPFRDQIYATWHNGVPVFFAFRTAGAAGAWQAPVQLSGAETTGLGIGGDIKTNAFGDVFVFWQDADGSRGIYVVNSLNGGLTFGPIVQIATTFASTRRLSVPADSGRQARVYISAGAYRTATKNLVYAVWTDLTGATGCTTGGGPGTSATSTCKTRVWFSRSTNAGANWSAPVMLNNQASLNDQFHSRLSVDESNGNLIVTYYDTVNDPNRLQTDVFMQTSTDDGVTWSSAVRITSARSDETTAGADGNQYGDYNGLHGFYGNFFPTWTDRRGTGPEEIWTAHVSIIQKRAFFVLDRSSFGQDEVKALVQQSSPNPAVIAPAFYVVVEGFTAAELGISAADLSGAPGVKPTFTSMPAVASMTIGAPTRLVAEDPSLPTTPQRFTWLYPITFANDSGFTAQLINVALNAAISSVSGSAILELRQQPNPYEIDGQTFWLSTDLRVFQLKAGQSKFGAPLPNPATTADASTFVKAAIGNLNAGTSGGQTFEGDLDPNATAVALYQTDTAGTGIFNFAVARVRYNALVQDATKVRVFFRLFPALTVSLAYDTATTYRRWWDGIQYGQAIALLGTQNSNILSIPCFAEQRVNPTTASMTTQQDPANTRAIVHAASGAEVDAYFGCLLDVNQPSEGRFPLNPLNDGPFTGSLQPILSLVRNQHQCLAAEISFDPDPIVPSATPATSDKLAQRNLSLILSPNPGGVESRRTPNTFEVRPTPAQLVASGRYDELMIDWGSLPAGSTARIYLPGASADEIIEIAAKKYQAHRLERLDAHTLKCTVGGVSYIPVPAGSDINYPALLTIDLPAGIEKGQRFDVVVRQITDATQVMKTPTQRAALAGSDVSARVNWEWRRVLGAFQVGIPVLTREAILGDEERLLSVLRWIGTTLPTHDRWYLVFRRYVDEIAQRVRGLGGDPDLIPPSAKGIWKYPPPAPGGPPEVRMLFTGKVTGLIYDHFGDFDGFLLETDEGERRLFSHEHAIEDVVSRAWVERILVDVLEERDDPRHPVEIVFRHAPRPSQS